MYKLLAFDLDGTLLNSKSELSSSTIDMIQKLAKKYIVVIITGRSYQKSKRYYSLLNLTTPIINGNGANIISPNDSSFTPICNDLDKHISKQILIQIRPYIDSALIENNDYIYYEQKDELIENFFAYDEGKKVDTLIEEADLMLHNVIVIKIKKNEYRNIIRQIVEANSGLKMLFWTDFPLFGEISSANTSKKHALLQLLDYYNISREEVIYFGDSFNDSELLEYIPRSYLMKNGRKELYKLAHNVTEYTNDEDGVVRVLEALQKQKIL